MLQYVLDTNIRIYVIKSRPVELREQFNRLTEQYAYRRSRSRSCISASSNRPGVLKTFGRLKSLSPDSKPCHFQSRRRPATAKSEPNWNERVSLPAPTIY